MLADAIATWRADEPEQAPPGIDWHRVGALAARHRVEGLAHCAGRLPGTGAPRWLVDELADRHRRDALHTLALLALQRVVMDALADAGIGAVVLKGAPLAVDAFGDVTARSNRDVDVLVDPPHVRAATHALESAGLRWSGWAHPALAGTTFEAGLTSPLVKHVEFVSPRGCVELHWRVTTNPRLLPVDPAWLRAPRTVGVAGARIPALPLDAELLHLVVHGASHRWQRMKWLADLPALVTNHPELLDAGRTPFLARASGVERCLAGGLVMAERCLGRFLSTEARAWIASVRGTGPLLRESAAGLASSAVTHRHIRPRGLPAHALGQLALRRDLGYRIAELGVMRVEAAHRIRKDAARLRGRREHDLTPR